MSSLIQIAENRFVLCLGVLNFAVCFVEFQFFLCDFVTDVFVVNKVNLIYIKLNLSF